MNIIGVGSLIKRYKDWKILMFSFTGVNSKSLIFSVINFRKNIRELVVNWNCNDLLRIYWKVRSLICHVQFKSEAQISILVPELPFNCPNSKIKFAWRIKSIIRIDKFCETWNVGLMFNILILFIKVYWKSVGCQVAC